jgi:uncharacterized SAM-binding protein YcdF (DUF218 family)
MTLSIFIVLGLLCIALSVLGYTKSSRVTALLSMVLFLAIGYGLIPYWAAAHLQSGYRSDYHGQWGTRSVIVLLGGGSAQLARKADVEPNLFGYPRIARAYAQYISCKQQGGVCMVLVTGGDPQSHHAPEAQIYALMLRRFGVPVSDLVTEERSRNTWENAKFSQPLIQATRADTVLLVTSGTHMYRSLTYFSHFGVNAVPVRADYLAVEFHALPTFYNFVVMDVVVHEYAGIARYYVYQLLGLN